MEETEELELYLAYRKYIITVKPVYNGHPWNPQKVASEHRWLLRRGCSIKIGMKISLAGPSLAIVEGGRCSEVVVKAGLIVVAKMYQS
jgi:hypothetical protein